MVIGDLLDQWEIHGSLLVWRNQRELCLALWCKIVLGQKIARDRSFW